jgi:hypothetical protein
LVSRKKVLLVVALIVILGVSIGAYAASLNPGTSHEDTVAKNVLDYASGFNETLQQKVIEGFRGNMTSDKAQQIEFLKTLPHVEQERSIVNSSFTDTDRDDDEMTNHLEQLAGLPWYVHNPRYAVVVNPRNDQSIQISCNDFVSFLTEEKKFEPGHVIKLVGNEATKEKVIQAFSDISKRSDENSIVLISLDGHSGEKSFCFNDGKGISNSTSTPYSISYEDMDKVIDSIRARRMLITISGCGLDAPIAPLSAGHAQRIVSDIQQHWIYNISDKFQKIGNAPTSKIYDLDKNGHISFDEIFKTTAKYQTGMPSVNISDKDSIASKFYIGD